MQALPHFRIVASALAAWTVAVAMSGPPCREPASCPMDETAAAPACDGMSSDCCEPAGERAPQGPATPALLAEPAGIAAAAAALPAPEPRRVSAEHSPPPAAFQGLGLYTLFAVFLI